MILIYDHIVSLEPVPRKKRDLEYYEKNNKLIGRIKRDGYCKRDWNGELVYVGNTPEEVKKNTNCKCSLDKTANEVFYRPYIRIRMADTEMYEKRFDSNQAMYMYLGILTKDITSKQIEI